MIQNYCTLIQIFSIGLYLWFSIATGVKAQELVAQPDGRIDEIFLTTPDFSGNESPPIFWEQEITQIGTEYLRLHINVNRVPEALRLTLELKDGDGNVIKTYSETDLKNNSPFWTIAIPGDYVLLTLYANQTPAGLKITIDKIAYQAFSGEPLSIFEDNELQPIAKYFDKPLIQTAARSVAKLLFNSNGEPKVCTGFLIDVNKLMTNQHCISEPEICDSIIAIFGYQFDEVGRLHFGEQFECKSIALQQSSYGLDFMVIELNGDPGNKWGWVSFSTTDPLPDTELFIVQHPAGEHKQISIINCKVSDIPVNGRSNKSDFAHTCDTVGGSSGSPVFDLQGRVVGLHHFGFNEPGPENWSENRAVRIEEIITILDR